MTVLSDLLYFIPIALGILAFATLLGWMVALAVRVAVHVLIDAWHAREPRATIRVGSMEIERARAVEQRLDRVVPVSSNVRRLPESPLAEVIDFPERATSERW